MQRKPGKSSHFTKRDASKPVLETLLHNHLRHCSPQCFQLTQHWQAHSCWKTGVLMHCYWESKTGTVLWERTCRVHTHPLQCVFSPLIFMGAIITHLDPGSLIKVYEGIWINIQIGILWWNKCSGKSCLAILLMSLSSNSGIRIKKEGQAWWHRPLVPASNRGRGRWIPESEARLVYRVSYGSQCYTEKFVLEIKIKI